MKVFSTEEISDIQASYRDAANQRKQIGILADLYNVTREDICGVLDIEDPTPSGKRPYKPRASYEQSVKDGVVRSVLLDHMTHKEVAERFGVPLGNVNKWVQKAKKKQAEFLNYDPQNNDKSHETLEASQSDNREINQENRTDLDPYKLARDLRAGVDGLKLFMMTFADHKLIDDDQWEELDRMRLSANSFAAGMEMAVGLMEVQKR